MAWRTYALALTGLVAAYLTATMRLHHQIGADLKAEAAHHLNAHDLAASLRAHQLGPVGYTTDQGPEGW